MKHILIYFPYALQKNPKSGSGVRPKRMVEAFKAFALENNLDVIVISGNSNERKKQTTDYIHSNKVMDATFCYMENSTVPFWLTDGDHVPRNVGVDMHFWKFLKEHHVPLGCFYRDVYWKFDDMYVPPFNLKALTPVMRSVYRKELKSYAKVVDIMYLPSLEMNDFVEWKGKFDELPPGMEKAPEDRGQRNPSSRKAVFVGGISDQKGILMLLEAFQMVNKKTEVQLELVCRKEEYAKYTAMHAYEKEPWLTVSHKSGEELKGVYENADIALIPREQNTYHHFAVPVKMFEYLANGLPIVATNCKAQGRILTDEGLGIVTEDNAESFADGVIKALDPNMYERMQDNVKNAYSHHSWKSRVEKVAHDLTKIRGGH